MENGNRTGQVFLAFLGGAAVGATVAYLTAPRSGAETREKIAEGFHAKTERIKHVPPAIREAYHAAADAARERFAEVYEHQTSTRH